MGEELTLFDTTTGTRKRLRRLLTRVYEERFWFGRVALVKCVSGRKFRDIPVEVAVEATIGESRKTVTVERHRVSEVWAPSGYRLFQPW